jgi:hypothetical protein
MTESPVRATTAPDAKRAIFPVEKMVAAAATEVSGRCDGEEEEACRLQIRP